MGITRRSFIGYAAGAATMVLPFDVWRSRASISAAQTGAGWVLLDMTEHAGLAEAASGYASALGSLGGGTRFMRAGPRPVPWCAGLIVPAALEIPPPALRAMVTCLEAGASVILESGAGFATRARFDAHRAVLRDALQVHIEAPVHLWAARSRPQGVPYVDYTWPYPAKLRDFSRVVPLGAQAGEIIASVAGLPVALKRRSGRGTLIFLGSPLGPALWAGDAEARRWLVDVVARQEASSRPRISSGARWRQG